MTKCIYEGCEREEDEEDTGLFDMATHLVDNEVYVSFQKGDLYFCGYRCYGWGILGRKSRLEFFEGEAGEEILWRGDSCAKGVCAAWTMGKT